MSVDQITSTYQCISVAITTQATIAELLNLLPKPQKHVIKIATKRDITIKIKERDDENRE